MTDALVIIDVQNAILDGAAADERVADINGYFDAMVKRLSALREKATDAKIPTILVQNDGPEGHRLAVGSDGWKIVPSLAPQENDIVVRKKVCDSFHETDLLDRLSVLGATRLIIGGCMTQYCVDTTVRHSVTLGFDVILLADGHCTGDSDDLRQDQIIAHHNQTLNGFDANDKSVVLMAIRDVEFSRE